MLFVSMACVKCQVTWQKVCSPNEDVICMATASNNIIYAGTQTYGVFKSADEGGIWENISGDLPDSTVRAMKVSTDNKLFIGTGSHGVHQFSAGSWSAINNGLPTNNLLVTDFCQGLDGNMFMMATTGGVYQWNGINWTNITYNLPPLGKCLAKNSTGQVYAGVFNSGVYKYDGVNNWTLVGDVMPNNFVIKMAITASDTIVAVCNSNNVYKCSIAGGAWLASNAGLPAINMNCIGVDVQNRLFIGTSSNNGSLYRSTNNGGLWTLVSTQMKTTVFNCVVTSQNNRIYVGASGVFKSADGGQNWSDQNHGMNASRIMLCFKCTRDGIFYIGNKLGVWRSTDNGFTWQLKNSGLSHFNVLQITETANGSLLLHAYNSVPKGAIYRSVNQGDSWAQVAANGCDFYTKIKQHKRDTLWASSRFSGATSLSYSTNDGLSWLNNGLMISAIWDIDLTKERTIFLGSESEGISRSDNGGQTFNLGVGNTTGWYGNVIEIERDDNGYIFAGGDWWTHILWFSRPEENGNIWTQFTDPDLTVHGVQDLIFDHYNNAYLACENDGFRMAYKADWSASTNWIASNSGLPSPNCNLLELSFDTSGYLYTVCSATNGHNAGLFRSVNPVNPPKSSVFVFNGNGSWLDAANWEDNRLPPATIAGNKIVIIDPGVNGECWFNVPITFSNGSILKVSAGKKLTLKL